MSSKSLGADTSVGLSSITACLKGRPTEIVEHVAKCMFRLACIPDASIFIDMQTSQTNSVMWNCFAFITVMPITKQEHFSCSWTDDRYRINLSVVTVFTSAARHSRRIEMRAIRVSVNGNDETLKYRQLPQPILHACRDSRASFASSFFKTRISGHVNIQLGFRFCWLPLLK